MDFEERLKRLEELAAGLRNGTASLEESVKSFEEGMKLAKSLEKDLAKIERRIEMVVQESPKEGEKPAMELFPELGDLS